MSMIKDSGPHNLKNLCGHSDMKPGPGGTPGQMDAAAVHPSKHAALREQDLALGAVPHLQLFSPGQLLRLSLGEVGLA